MCLLLASGVFFSGVIKDLVCIPRPLSPPLHRISKSPTAALEYGLPSTHSTNALSVAVYGVYLLRQSPQGSWWNTAGEYLLYFYTVTILVGRIYCGMHGFFDVFIGSLLGAILGGLHCLYGETFDLWICTGPFKNIVIFSLLVLVLVRTHPEPADNCPCFDDSVAFSGVIIGIQLGGWHFARSGFALSEPVPSTTPYSLQDLGLAKSVFRTLAGIVIIFLWRGAMKSTLFKVLPPLFRVIEHLGLSLPREFFLKAS